MTHIDSSSDKAQIIKLVNPDSSTALILRKKNEEDKEEDEEALKIAEGF